VKAKTELDDRIRHVWKKATFHPVYFPSEAIEVDDDAREPKLVVVHYDADTASATGRVPPDLVTKLFNHAGGQESYRTCKNNVLFLVADQDQVDRMVDVVQEQRSTHVVLLDADPSLLPAFAPWASPSAGTSSEDEVPPGCSWDVAQRVGPLSNLGFLYSTGQPTASTCWGGFVVDLLTRPGEEGVTLIGAGDGFTNDALADSGNARCRIPANRASPSATGSFAVTDCQRPRTARGNCPAPPNNRIQNLKHIAVKHPQFQKAALFINDVRQFELETLTFQT
jgi:hypothetical protein